MNLHPDFGGRVVERQSFWSADPDPWARDVSDCVNHGTPAASIVAGATYGVAKQAEVISFRVTNCVGFGGWISADVIAAFNEVAARKQLNPSQLMVVNFSGSGSPDQQLDDAVLDVVNLGVPVAMSAGNDGGDSCNSSPARIGNANAGATNVGGAYPLNDVVTADSNQGPCVDLFAPYGTEAASADGGSRYFDGTSSSAPHVAGVYVKLMETYPSYSAGELEGIMKGWAVTGYLSDLWVTSNDLLLQSMPQRRRGVSR